MKKNFILQISDEARNDLENVASAAHTTANQYAAQFVNELALLKPEFALKALGLIPPDWKHRRPGRPTGSRTTDRQERALPQQDVA